MPTTFSVKMSTRRSFQWGGRTVPTAQLLAPSRQAGAQVFADPSDEVACLRIREAAGGGRRFLHAGEQGLLFAPDRLRPGVPGRFRLGGGVEGGDLRGLLGFAVFVRQLGALVVRARRAREQAGARKWPATVRCSRFAGPRPFPLPLHRRAVPRERDGECLDGGEQLLLQTHHEQSGGGPGARRAVLEALLPQLPVLIEETGENQLRGILRKTVDRDALHLPFRKAALDFADVLLDAPHHHVFERVLSPDRHPSGEAVRIEQLEQGGEAVGVAVVGRRGQEQAVLEAPSEIADCARELRLFPVTPAARRRGVMGFVQDEDAPRKQLAQPFAHGVRVGRIDEQVVGHEKAAVGAPRVDPEAPLLANPREIRTVEDYEEETEAFLHLRLPLLQDGRGCGDDERPRLLAKQSSRAMSPASMVLPRPVSSAMKRLTRGMRSALRSGSIW